MSSQEIARVSTKSTTHTTMVSGGLVASIHLCGVGYEGEHGHKGRSFSRVAEQLSACEEAPLRLQIEATCMPGTAIVCFVWTSVTLDHTSHFAGMFI
jgi:hypothetical protein